MKNILLFLCFFLSVAISNAQDKERFKVLSKQTLQHLKDARNCWDNTEESCIPFYKRMVESARKKSECVPCAEIELAKGYFDESDTKSAIVHLDNVLEAAKNIKQERLKLELEQDAYGLLSICYSIKGETGIAINYLIEKGKRAEKLGDKEQVAIVKGNMGVFYSNMKNYEKGIQFQKIAIKELNALGKAKKTAAFAANIASAYIDINLRDSALAWAKTTVKIATQQKDIASETAGYYLVGAAFEKTNIDSAMYYVNKSIPLAIKTNNIQFLATSYNIKGNLHAQKKQYPEAKKYFLESIKIYRSLGKPIGLSAPLKTLGSEAFLAKDFETASTYMNEYISFQDSVVSQENRQLVHELNTKYETEKKKKLLVAQQLKIEKEQNQKSSIVMSGIFAFLIALLAFLFYHKNQKTKEQKLIQKKENEVLSAFISGEERERNRISHELHDGVASMIGVAKMNLETLPHLPKESQQEQIQRVIKILENTHSDVRHIAHNLLPITLQQEGLIKATEQFANEINKTGVLSISIINKISSDLNIPEQKQLMIFRMIQELVHNVVKHSQAQNATVSFDLKNNNLTISVSDDGIGIKNEILIDNQGLYSIQQRISSILGRFTFQNNQLKGTTAVLEINI